MHAGPKYLQTKICAWWVKLRKTLTLYSSSLTSLQVGKSFQQSHHSSLRLSPRNTEDVINVQTLSMINLSVMLHLLRRSKTEEPPSRPKFSMTVSNQMPNQTFTKRGTKSLSKQILKLSSLQKTVSREVTMKTWSLIQPLANGEPGPRRRFSLEWSRSKPRLVLRQVPPVLLHQPG